MAVGSWSHAMSFAGRESETPLVSFVNVWDLESATHEWDGRGFVPLTEDRKAQIRAEAAAQGSAFGLLAGIITEHP